MNIQGRRAYLSGIRVECKSGSGKGDYLVADICIPLRIRDEDGDVVDDELRDWLKEQLVRPQILDPVDFGRLRELTPDEATPAQVDRLEAIKRRASMEAEIVQPVPHAWSQTLRISAEAAVEGDFDDDESSGDDAEWDPAHPPRLNMSSAVAEPKMRVALLGDRSATVTLRVRCRTSFVSNIGPLDVGRLQRFPSLLDIEVRGQQLALTLGVKPTATPIVDSMLDGA